MSAIRLGIFALCFFSISNGLTLDNDKNVKENFYECYENISTNTAQYRPPATLNVLLDLIRRVEDGKSVLSLRDVAVSMVKRFRQDGIIKIDLSNQMALPYSPNGYQYDRNFLLFTSFIPGDTTLFPEDTLNSVEKCALHFLLSNTFDLKKRDDEGRECRQLGKYVRVPRLAELEEKKQSEDVEAIPTRIPKGYNTDEGLSACPIERGVVYTKYGSLQAGTIITAIAAALENQQYRDNDTVATSVYAATVAGDIVETAFQQGVVNDTYNVGIDGGWNSTYDRKYYMVNANNLNELTHAESRADIDGLIMAKKLQEWRSRVSDIKLSQILDMYYSPRGVFSQTKACERKTNVNDYIQRNTLMEEATGFGKLYSQWGSVKGSIRKDRVPTLVGHAVDSFIKFVPDLDTNYGCDVNDTREKISTEITIVIDGSWEYSRIHLAISYLMEHLELNKYDSNYTLISGQDGKILIDASHSISEFHINYTEAIHKDAKPGFAGETFMFTIEQRLSARFNGEKLESRTSGRSHIVLLLPNSAVSSDVGNFLQTRINNMYKDFFPDLKFYALCEGTADNCKKLLPSNEDVFVLPAIYNDQSTTEVEEVVLRLKKRILETPRRLSNYKCGARMTGEVGTITNELYIEQGTRNYYKIAPNYFSEGEHTVKVKTFSDSLTICSSRMDKLPKKDTNNCKVIAGPVEHTFPLSDACEGTVQDCQPFYLSVEAPVFPQSNTKCTDKNKCRYPDSIKFSVTLENAMCKSGAGRLMSGLLVLVAFVTFILGR